METLDLDQPAETPAIEVCSEARLPAELSEAKPRSLYATPREEPAPEAPAVEPEPEGEDEAPLLIPPAQCWSTLHTHSRSEKVVARRLEKLEVPHYLPLGLVKRSYGTRVRTSLVPLFPGYVFFDSKATDKYRILDSRRVVRIIPCPEPEQLRVELTNIARMLVVKPDLKRIDFGPPGSPVEVICGPFEGMRAEVVRYEGKTRLMVRIPYLQLATAVSIEEAWLKSVPAEEAIS